MKQVKIPKKEFVSEHKHLVNMLMKAKSQALKKEGRKQKKELKSITK